MYNETTEPSNDFKDVTNVTVLMPINNVERQMRTEGCPNNIGSFREKMIFKFLTNGHLFTDDGKTVEIFEKDFCLENFFSSNDKFYVSVLICKNAIPIRNSLSPTSVNRGCWNLIDQTGLYRELRLAYSICGLFSLIFLSLTLFLYMTIQGSI